MKPHSEDTELYVFAESKECVVKERAMRQLELKWLWGTPEETGRNGPQS
jgi:hypothetical protein